MAEAQPTQLDAMIQMLTAMREDMGAMRTDLGTVNNRLDRLEQPPRRIAMRNVNPQPNIQREDDIPVREDDPPDHQRAPDPPHMRRDPLNRNRIREEDQQRQGKSDVKITPPTFAGKVDPEAYLDWERRMEYIFDCYGYNEPRKIALASAQLTEHALSWWDREVAERRRNHYPLVSTWSDMKFYLRRRYVPPHFHRELQKRFRKLFQGQKTVEEYFDEFESLKNRLELNETEETLMAQFIDGLQDRVARKVERLPYHDIHELLHMAIQAEQQIKKKTATAQKSRTTNSWSPTPPPALDKGKSTVLDSRFKDKSFDHHKESRFEQGKSSGPTRTHELTCYRCKGRGHIARECPNHRVMILTPSGEYDSQDEDEQDETEEIMLYAEEGESLMITRVLNSQAASEEDQRENLFHTRCAIKDKVCHMIIDSGSCTNIASTVLVEKLGLKTTTHPKPYKLKWLNDSEELKVAKQVIVPFMIGQYKDQVTCDVVPMEAGHILLGRPWQYDREVSHNGRTNHYSFAFKNQKIILAPLDQAEVRKMQARAKEKTSYKVSLLLEKATPLCYKNDIPHLFLSSVPKTGSEVTNENITTTNIGVGKEQKKLTNVDQKHTHGVIYSLLIKEAPPIAIDQLKQRNNKIRGTSLSPYSYSDPNLLYLNAEKSVSRSKHFQEGEYDEDIQTMDLYGGDKLHASQDNQRCFQSDGDHKVNCEAHCPSMTCSSHKPPWSTISSHIRAQYSGESQKINSEKFKTIQSILQLNMKKGANQAQDLQNLSHMDIKNFHAINATPTNIKTSQEKPKTLCTIQELDYGPIKETCTSDHFELFYYANSNLPNDLECLKHLIHFKGSKEGERYGIKEVSLNSHGTIMAEIPNG